MNQKFDKEDISRDSFMAGKSDLSCMKKNILTR